MEPRLTLISKSSIPQYASGSPLLLNACALHLDNVYKSFIAQLKWQNISEKAIRAVMIDLVCFDAFEHEVEKHGYQYVRLNVDKGAFFGEKEAIVLEHKSISRYQVCLRAISYADGTKEEFAEPKAYCLLPEAKPQELQGELLEQYKRDLSHLGLRTSVRCQTQRAAGLWQCICGSWQREGRPCLACGATQSILEQTAELTELERNLQEYNAEQERRHLEAQRKAEEEQRIRKQQEEERRIRQERERQLALEKEAARRKKRNKHLAIAGACLAVLILAGCCAKFFFIPMHHYNTAVTLLTNGQYDEAAAAFAAAGDYQDAAERVGEPFYKQAEALLAEGKYDEAYQQFLLLKGYKDVDTLLATDQNLLAEAAREAKIAPFKQVGQYVTYGAYEQDNNLQNSKEPIEWLVLDYDEAAQEVLLISRYGLDVRPYHHTAPRPTWAKSDIRAWLNNEFLSTAFTAEERSAVAETNLSTPDYNGNDGGADTVDKVFLLSEEEVSKYFANDAARMAVPTKYAVDQSAWRSDNYTCKWWLRSPAYDSDFAYFVSEHGLFYSCFVSTSSYVAVRPAFKLYLGAL